MPSAAGTAGVAHQILLFESILAVISGAMDAQLAGAVSMAIVMVFALQVMEKMSKDEMKKGEIELCLNGSKFSAIVTQGFLALCLVACNFMVNSASSFWNYQEDIPDRIQRKFENR